MERLKNAAVQVVRNRINLLIGLGFAPVQGSACRTRQCCCLLWVGCLGPIAAISGPGGNGQQEASFEKHPRPAEASRLLFAGSEAIPGRSFGKLHAAPLGWPAECDNSASPDLMSLRTQSNSWEAVGNSLAADLDGGDFRSHDQKDCRHP